MHHFPFWDVSKLHLFYLDSVLLLNSHITTCDPTISLDLYFTKFTPPVNKIVKPTAYYKGQKAATTIDILVLENNLYIGKHTNLANRPHNIK